METRLVVAYALIALLVFFAALLAWHRLTRDARRRKRERTMRERWLGLPAATDQP
jgi:cytochrome c biogenesis protein CcdA